VAAVHILAFWTRTIEIDTELHVERDVGTERGFISALR
jgi:hypothetical protein